MNASSSGDTMGTYQARKNPQLISFQIVFHIATNNPMDVPYLVLLSGEKPVKKRTRCKRGQFVPDRASPKLLHIWL